MSIYTDLGMVAASTYKWDSDDVDIMRAVSESLLLQFCLIKSHYPNQVGNSPCPYEEPKRKAYSFSG